VRRHPAVLRFRTGHNTRAQLESALGESVADRDEAAPRASGTLAAHYAPRTALVLLDYAALAVELEAQANVAVLALSEPPLTARVTSWITAPATPQAYGHDLYANLRKLDASGAKRILVAAPPENEHWEAVNDRLARAAAGSLPLDDEP